MTVMTSRCYAPKGRHIIIKLPVHSVLSVCVFIHLVCEHILGSRRLYIYKLAATVILISGISAAQCCQMTFHKCVSHAI